MNRDDWYLRKFIGRRRLKRRLRWDGMVWQRDDGAIRESSYQSAYVRRIANRKVRRTMDIPSGRCYAKVFDYWWEVT